MRVGRRIYRALGLVVALVGLACAPSGVFASSDPRIDALPVGGAGVGFLWRYERSLYKGAPSNLDNLPLYLYEGERAYLHGTRLGLKFASEGWRFANFLNYRFEGFNRDNVP